MCREQQRAGNATHKPRLATRLVVKNRQLEIRRRRWHWNRVRIFIFSAVLGLFLLPGYAGADRMPARGKLLVADKSLIDPNFYQSVLLLVDYNENGSMGIVINRASDISPSSLLPDIQELESYNGQIYVGGPVAVYGVLVLLKSGDTPGGAENVFGAVHISGDSKLLRQLSASGLGEHELRLYAGYAGWTAGQLENEIERGDWHVLPATEELVFSERPQDIWKQLVPASRVIIADLALDAASL
jgi:putative transcriptional regulator